MIILFITIFFTVFSLFMCIVSAMLIKKYVNLAKKIKIIQSDTGKILVALKRVRYGDINVRLENLQNSELENVANRLFETIADREMMIKEYQATLSKKNLSLEEVLTQEKQLRRYKEEVVATLTHDMKVPVVAELNSINFLLEGRFGELTEKQKQALNLMKTSNQELKDLIENILETFRLEQKKLELNIQKHDFNKFVLSAIDEMNPILLKSSHKITFEPEKTENLNIFFDDFQIRRIVKNLIQNAVTFSPAGSEIIIKTFIKENYLKLAVTNKGSGISKDDLEKIFNKYYSGQSKYRKTGTGLGLFLSNKIALAHNGKLEVDCSVSGYTTFILSLPI